MSFCDLWADYLAGFCGRGVVSRCSQAGWCWSPLSHRDRENARGHQAGV